MANDKSGMSRRAGIRPARALVSGLSAGTMGLAALAGGWVVLAPGAAQAQTVCVMDPAAPAATAAGLDSFACGPAANAHGELSVAVGRRAGFGSDAANNQNMFIGGSAGEFVTGSGNAAAGTGAGSFTIGDGNSAFGQASGVSVIGNENTAVGFAAGQNVTGDSNLATGLQAGGSVGGSDNVALGTSAGRVVTGDRNIGIGLSAGGSIDGSDNIALGQFAGRNVVGDGNTAAGLGAGLAVTGDTNTASGFFAGAYVTGSDNVALGSRAGSGTDVTPLAVSRTVAIGADSRAGFDGSTALGAGAQTARANQVAIGTAANTYTLAGIASAESRAVQQGDLFFVTADAQGNLATTTLDIPQLASLDGRVGALENEVAATRREARQGIAASIAMASAPMPSTVGRTSWAMNVGHFKGESALGGSLTHRFDTALPLGFTVGYAYGGGNSHAARIGLMGEF